MNEPMQDPSPEEGRRVRVLVVEDHDGFRTGLSMLLEERGLEVVGQCADGAEAVRVAARVAPDVVLMDLELPLVNGIEATTRILEAAPDTNVLVLTVSGKESDVVDAMLAGASGYL